MYGRSQAGDGAGSWPARAFNNAGFCAAHLQLWDEALWNMQESIRLDPSLQLAKNNLTWMQQEKLKAAAAQTR